MGLGYEPNAKYGQCLHYVQGKAQGNKRARKNFCTYFVYCDAGGYIDIAKSIPVLGMSTKLLQPSYIYVGKG